MQKPVKRLSAEGYGDTNILRKRRIIMKRTMTAMLDLFAVIVFCLVVEERGGFTENGHMVQLTSNENTAQTVVRVLSDGMIEYDNKNYSLDGQDTEELLMAIENPKFVFDEDKDVFRVLDRLEQIGFSQPNISTGGK